jgi:hypothetical protein
VAPGGADDLKHHTQKEGRKNGPVLQV